MDKEQIIKLLQRTIDHEDPDRQYIGYLADKISELIEQQVLIGRKAELSTFTQQLENNHHDAPIGTARQYVTEQYIDRLAELDRLISKLTGEKNE